MYYRQYDWSRASFPRGYCDLFLNDYICKYYISCATLNIVSHAFTQMLGTCGLAESRPLK